MDLGSSPSPLSPDRSAACFSSLANEFRPILGESEPLVYGA